jgi:starch synthase
LRIVHVAAEAVPFSKVGGLADVAAALPAALAARGHDVTLVTPLHRGTAASGATTVAELELAGERARLLHLATSAGVETLLVDCPALFDRPGVYGEPDDGERFAALVEAALGVGGDVLHAHDWHAALACVRRPRGSVLTIHNLAFHGDQSPDFARRHGLALPPAPGDTRADAVGLLGRGIAAAEIVTTVSPTYANEILTPEHGCGLDALLRGRGVTGIANGIDTDLFDPARDPAIAAGFSADDPGGREVCRRALRDEFGLRLPGDAPLVGVVSRLTEQKGLDLLVAALPTLRAAGAGLVVLGAGDPGLERAFLAAAEAEPAAIAVRVGFDAALAQRIYAGCDLFAMPSRFEPCGLGQMIAMRYGALPVVRRTGGLADTVGEATGFLFDDASVAALADAFERAAAAFRDRARREAMIGAALSADNSWDRPAAAYEALYAGLGAR